MSLVEELIKKTVPCAPVYTLPQVMQSSQVAARNMLVTVDDPIAGPTRIVGNPIKMSSVDDYRAIPSPALAAQTQELMISLGKTPQQIAKLAEHGGIALPDQHPHATPPCQRREKKTQIKKQLSPAFGTLDLGTPPVTICMSRRRTERPAMQGQSQATLMILCARFFCIRTELTPRRQGRRNAQPYNLIRRLINKRRQ